MRVFIVFIVSLLAISIAYSSAASAPSTLNRVTLYPEIIPLEDPELVNPGRGFYLWRGEAVVPLPEPAQDEYERYYWYDADHPEDSLETAKGVYNFAPIDRAIAAAAERGHKFAFRVRAMAGLETDGRYIPDYLAGCGWDYRGTFIPDWNRLCFQENAEGLFRALGERYNGDPRIAWIDIGLYGEWGEWALSEGIYNSAPVEIEPPSEQSLEKIIDLQVDAFPDTRKVMFAKTRSDAVIHALGRSKEIGWRVDCFGRHGYFNFATHPKYMPAWEIMQERWKTAPVIVEFCSGEIALSYEIPLKQVQDFHIALIGNGNIREWSKLNPQKQENLVLVGKIAGYRYQIKEITIPAVWVPGATNLVTTHWENVGAAPHYERTAVAFRLYDPRRSIYFWESESTLDLQKLLPTGDRPRRVQDRFSLPEDLPHGSYQLRLMVEDPTGYRLPLKLAIQGRQDDGSYLLGNIVVGTQTGRR